MTTKVVAPVVLAAMITGCATPFITQQQANDSTGRKATEHVRQFEETSRPASAVREIDTPRVDFKKTTAPRILGDINVKAANAPFAPILSEIARNAGYSVAFGDMVDANRKITIDFNRAHSEDAIRTTAFLAGYAAVIDRERRTVYIADKASYVFRLPSSVFSNLQAQYSVGGNPANATGGEGSGGTSLKAEFSVQGTEGSNPAGLSGFLKDLAGPHADVMVSDSGMITVRGNGQALRRVHEFMQRFARSAMTQVEIEASVVEVALSNEFEMGINWNKVVNTALSGVSVGSNTGVAVATFEAAASGDMRGLVSELARSASGGSLGAYRVAANATTIISALSQFTEVNVVSQPKLVSMNNVPATFFDGTQLPYLGSVQQSQGTGDSAPTVTGTVAFAIDGVSFSVVPSVIDQDNVQITLIPVLSNVTNFTEFLGGQITAPHQSNKQTYMRVIAESNKTLILGGIRYSREAKETQTGTRTARRGTAKEVVILLRSNVIPAPNVDPVISESL